MPHLEAGGRPYSTFPWLPCPAAPITVLWPPAFLFLLPLPPQALGWLVKSHVPVHSPEPKISSPQPLLIFLLPSKRLCSRPLSCAITPPCSAYVGEGFPHRSTSLAPWPAPGLLMHFLPGPLSFPSRLDCIRACLRPVRTCLSGGPFLDGWPDSNTG